MKKFNNKTFVISAASLIISGMASAEVIPEAGTGDVPGVGNKTSTFDQDSTTVPEPYLPETTVDPFSWNYTLPNEANQTPMSHRSFLALQDPNEEMSIRSAQQILNDLGYSIAVDGIAGRETKSAIKDFQAANGIAQTGKLDASTVTALRDVTYFDPDRYPASFEDENLPYESAFPPFPDGDSSFPDRRSIYRGPTGQEAPR